MLTDKKISELPIATSVNASDISVLVNGDTDYQYTFTLLLQFLQANLTTGANISFGATLPQNTSGKNGDVFVNTSAGSFAQKISGTWTVVYTLPAANAADGALLYGAGLPASATGKDLDSYINTLTGIFYKKSAGAWSQVFSMATGPRGPQGIAGTNGTDGANGNTILFGTTNPSNSTTGVNGNFYINTSNYTLFGPKTAGVWGNAVSLLGAGVTNGGTAGQILVKVDDTDFNTDWQDNSFAHLSGNPADNANLSAALAAKQDSLGYAPENSANKNQANGYAGLDGSGKVTASQLPSYVDDVLEFANYAVLPTAGETGKIYVTLDNNAEYRWSGSTYIQLVASPGSTDAVPEGTTNLYFTTARVLATILTGIGFSSATAITATDTILGALGKLQAQISALFKIPAGGTAGQILAKVDGTDGNSHWIDAPAGGGGAYADRSFNEILTFDVNFKMETSQTGDIDFVLGSSPVADIVARIIITGDGIHNVTFPSDWTNANGQLFDNQQKNIIYLEYDGTEILYSIVKVIIPDIIAPYIISAVIENANKNKIVLTYSELLDETTVPSTGAFSINLSKAVTAVAINGTNVTLTINSNYISADVPTVSYTPDGNPIQDVARNSAAALVNQAVVNNVSPARESVYITALNQVQVSPATPAGLDYSGTDGLVQKPFSTSMWVKRNNTTSGSLVTLASASGSDQPQFSVQMDNTGNVSAVFYGSGGHGGHGYTVITADTNIPSNVWTHLTFTSDGSGTYAGMKIYYNSALQPSHVGFSDAYSPITSMATDFRLGVLGDSSAAASQNINIRLTCLYFWMRNLSQSDINALYNLGVVVDPTTMTFAADLRARYEFNGDAIDSVGGYNLTSVVAPVYVVDAP